MNLTHLGDVPPQPHRLELALRLQRHHEPRRDPPEDLLRARTRLLVLDAHGVVPVAVDREQSLLSKREVQIQ